ncbi:DUF4360 domain-containing protein [Actinophytocola sp.]|uniref:DUF4360 domain-containing protein n=1 Tax=Actinophytocola sp. TaxID=1872138 RepID=UPI002ED05AF7
MRSRSVVSGAVILTLFSHLFIPSASATESLDAPPTSEVVVDVVAVNGTGCPPGTAGISVSPDNTTFTVTYDQYLARLGVGAAPTDFRKSCQLNMGMHVPDGYTYAISRAEFRGFASLAAGATGRQRAGYYFAGQVPTPFHLHTFTGPLEDEWQTVDEIGEADMIFHPCGAQRNLNISTELRVLAGTSDPATSTSSLAMKSSASTIYHLQWKHCA